MTTIQTAPVRRGAEIARGFEDQGAPVGASCPHAYVYVKLELAGQTEHQRLAEASRAAAEASGVLDFIRDDPLLDDYTE